MLLKIKLLDLLAPLRLFPPLPIGLPREHSIAMKRRPKKVLLDWNRIELLFVYVYMMSVVLL